MTDTTIAWTDKTWNPVRGCARVSPGCEHCYAERTAYRFNSKGQPYEGLTVLGKHGPRWAGRARFVPEKLAEPLHWRKPQRIFVNSMSDLFHDDVTEEEVAAIFGVMAMCPQHTFQILTKRPRRMLSWFQWLAREAPSSFDPGRGSPFWQAFYCADRVSHYTATPKSAYDIGYALWPLKNVWLGVSCEDQQRANERIPLLLQTPAAVRFVSAEPLLGPIHFNAIHGCTDLDGGGREDWWENALSGKRLDIYAGEDEPASKLDWVIVGGESGPGARPCNVDWVRDIVRQCTESKVACFVKQLGSAPAWSNQYAPGGQFVGKTGKLAAGAEYLHLDGMAHGPLRDLKGGDINEWPEDLRVRQFPDALEAT